MNTAPKFGLRLLETLHVHAVYLIKLVHLLRIRIIVQDAFDANE